MGNLIVTIKNPADFQLLSALLQRLGLESYAVSEPERRWLARRRLVEGVDQIPPGDNISEEEIQAEVEAVRLARHSSND